MAPLRALHPDAVDTTVIRRFTEALASVADAEPLDTEIPTCGAWTLADLCWHLAEVQYFWAHIIENRPTGPDDYVAPERVDDSDLGANLRHNLDRLVAALDQAEPEQQAWSWAAEQTVGFTVRRQSHEALVHSIDGLLGAGHALPAVDPQLAADGVDEMLRVMFVPESTEGEYRSLGIVELRATDSGDSWVVDFGHFGEHEGAVVRDGAEPQATFSGRALDLDLWLWNRPTGEPIASSGDQAIGDVFATFAIGSDLE